MLHISAHFAKLNQLSEASSSRSVNGVDGNVSLVTKELHRD